MAYIDTEKDIHSAEMSEASTRPPSVFEDSKNMAEKINTDHKDDVIIDRSGLTPSETAPTEFPKGVSLYLIVLSTVLAVFLMSLDAVRTEYSSIISIIWDLSNFEETIVATAIPRITDDFHSLDDVSWYASAFFMTIGGFQSTWGKAYKFFPLKTTFLLSLFLFEVGSLVCGVAPNSLALIIGRAIAGIGGAGIGSGAFTIVAIISEPKLRPTLIGILGAAYGIGAAIGPLVGGAFSGNVSWRWCIYAPFWTLSVGYLLNGIPRLLHQSANRCYYSRNHSFLLPHTQAL
jgi:MFS transporter, DHA2 family, glioxin efflux transporter